MSQKYFVLVKDVETMWFKDPEMTVIHRLDGPAIEMVNGLKYWFQDGKKHRLDGPAFEGHGEHRIWYQNGEYHRVDGPAIEMADGDRYWYQHGRLHRLDGPAVEWVDGRVEYYIEGQKYPKRDFTRRVKELTRPQVKEMTMAELEKALGHPIKIIK